MNLSFVEGEFQYLVQQRGWIIYHIRKFIDNHRNRKRTLFPCELNEIYSLYRSLKGTYRNPAYNKHYFNWVLGYIMEQTYESKIDDTEFVYSLISSLLEIDGHIGLILRIGLVDSATNVPNNNILAYYLAHSTRKRILFGDVRIHCAKIFDGEHWIYPLELAIQIKSPVIFYQFLRYGALWSHQGYAAMLRSKKFFGSYTAEFCKELLKQIVQQILFYNPEIDHLRNLEEPARSYCQHLINCGVLLLRDSALYNYKMFRRVRIGDTNISNLGMVSTLLAKMDSVVWPGFSDRFSKPMTLKHASKLKIRKILNDNWHLPQGIYHMGLPKCLENYLDLTIE